MIKELSTIGFFIKFNESASAGINLVRVYSSSSTATLLFTASTTSSKSISVPSGTSYFINGTASGTLEDSIWQHVTLTINPKLQTEDPNNFIVRFGQEGFGDFQVQNLYLLDEPVGPIEVRCIHNSFTGASAIVVSGETSSASLLVSDRDERVHSSSVTFDVYQPYTNQTRFFGDISLVTESSLSSYIGSPTVKLQGDNRFFDGFLSALSDIVLSTADNQLYRINSTGGVDTVSTSNGDYVRVLSGLEYTDTVWLKSSGSFSQAPFLYKVDYLLDNS